jgi:cardiolipin synthase
MAGINGKTILEIVLSTHALWIISYVFGLILIPRILMDRRRTGATLAWILTIGFLPYIGVPFYFIFGGRRVRRRIEEKLQISSVIEPHISRKNIPLSGAAHAVTEIFRSVDLYPPLPGFSVKLIDNGMRAYRELVNAIEQAHDHIHLEFFILKNDDTGKALLSLLADKARAGIKVRLLLDALGSFCFTRRMFKQYIAAGGQLAFFLPVIPFHKKWSANLRNHRKLVIIDHAIVFTGGMNLAREYMSDKVVAGQWRDFFIKITGDQLWPFQKVFLDDWAFATLDRNPTGNFSFPLFAPGDTGNSIVQVVPSGPDQEYRSLYHGAVMAMHRAQKRIVIATPYFIPDEGIYEALEVAGIRKLEVILIVPRKSNHPMALWAGRSYYQDLLNVGVKIYEYAPSMLHAKAMVIDDDIGVVGSANIDFRSFNLNFELSVFLYQKDDVYGLHQMLRHLIDESIPLDPVVFAARHVSARFWEGACRLLSPVL